MGQISENPPQQRPRTLADQVHETLCEMLLSGQLKPRDRISLRDLAERLDVSMMPVREAVSRLAASGALLVEPKRAVQVPLISAAEFEDLTEMRMLTEGQAARLAAERATPEQIEEILALAARFEELLDSAYGTAEPVAANKDLHFALYRAAGSPVLMDVIRMLWLKAGPIINYDIGVNSLPLEEEMTRSRTHHSRSHHRQLCEALEARDAEAAALAVTEDIRVASELIRARAEEELEDSRRRLLP
ncbi:GntR family transcriptional regulator [Salipiger sp. PrR002]|uniref:GntR family transcriptional regulator n=1 Tax=Salipiger sp. PrR002 TaxID=2706489 RepID=UPI0013BAD7CF|nr:GntR family transcriptional regulator [Salipiger sp. PrR002]NDW01197.1 GntR family transcriptional regulator [Salipiger sp. PrR002]NDW58861.1 GntR family transcriptional regulator [Salipiger sp. PrR004]